MYLMRLIPPPWRNEWVRASTWSPYLGLNRRFLQGSLTGTPYYYGPIDEETLPLLPRLLEMHDYGFLTVGSQPSNGGTFEGHEWRSRGYVRFLVPTNGEIPTALVEAFCDELLKLESIIVVVQNADGEILKHNEPVPTLPLHQSRSSTLDDWTEETSTSNTLLNENPDMELFREADCHALLEARPLNIFVATAGFLVASSLEKRIIDCATSCGIAPLWQQVRSAGSRDTSLGVPTGAEAQGLFSSSRPRETASSFGIPTGVGAQGLFSSSRPRDTSFSISTEGETQDSLSPFR